MFLPPRVEQRDIARQPERRHHSGTECGRAADENSQPERNSLETDFLESRNVRGRKGDQNSKELSRHPGANEATQKCEGKAFDEKQPDDSSVAGAKSLAHGNLLLTRCASKQEQIADVETRREQ